jgi:UDP-N-acetylmuramate--alanine ligase
MGTSVHVSSPYFFCGIGGSGMLPLALILKGHRAQVAGSDRALDQGRTAAKFDYLRAHGIALFPQDGSGITSAKQILVCSAAVEDTIPDVQAAKRLGAKIMTRAELLAELFNAAPQSIGVAGTSGKSTVTGMIGWILTATGMDPTIMNGAVMKNFVNASEPFASARVGKSGVFVSEVDESDGSIAQYSPRVAVLNNISLDHKSMDELRALFRDFLAKAKVAVFNLDNEETARLADTLPSGNKLLYGFADPRANFGADKLTPRPDGISFDLIARDPFSVVQQSKRFPVKLNVPGGHNVANALAAIAACWALGIAPGDSIRALEAFSGVRRRLESVGTRNGVTVIDDFAHNPDKITATLATLHDFPGRLLLMFQPHGFGPLKKMGTEFIETFATQMAPQDVLVMPDPVYYGGTTDKSVTSADIVAGVRAKGREAYGFARREDCGQKLIELAKPGDRIVIMGARDDTLSTFAGELLAKL